MPNAFLQIAIERTVTTAVRPSPRVLETAMMFGLGVDESRTLTIVPRTSIPLPKPGIVFITGPSGGGKSTVLSLIANEAHTRNMAVIDFSTLDEPPDVPLLDAFDLPLKDTTALLSIAGLGDAFVMLRRPCELSDGQRFRLRLAQAMARAERIAPDQGAIILADEFGATLDRVTAAVIARNVRRWISRTNHTFIAATTHDDLLEPLEPDVLVHKGLGEAMDVNVREHSS